MFGVVMEYKAITKQVLSPESAAAGDIFDQFANAQTFKSVQGTFRQLCDTLRLKPTNFPNFYPKLKAKLRSWKAQALWSKFDKRASHRCYNRGKACANIKVLIIGAGPCGLRAAIEAQLLGAKVVVVEKRDRFSRNNVLHLWPFVIHDLRNLGAKKFYGKFCAGAIDHISIRQLQCVLLKVALLLGVEVHENVAFDDMLEPPPDQSLEKIGWKALVTPREHPLSYYEFDVLVGADGKRNTLKGFKRKEFRGKLAIAITANFINRHSEAEACVQEISGVAFIFNQKFFQDLRDHTGIDLENIVYYKDETHYFVMTAKKYSLIEKGVILIDFADTARLLAPENVNKEALFSYAREAADFSTNFQMPHLDFAVNHYGQEDVAMFDFTSMYAAESACRVVERRGHKILQALVGDSLLEPFWPTGSGCARGFLSSMDTCWMIRSWALGTMTSLQVLAERESIFRLLAQTTPENLSKDYNDYSLNPASRYPNLNANAVRPIQVQTLYDTDIELNDGCMDIFEVPKKKRKMDSHIHPDALLNWCQRQVISYSNVSIENMTTSWKDGLALAAIVHRFRPDLIDFHALTAEEEEKNNQLALDICEREFAIHPVFTAKEMTENSAPDVLAVVSYVSQIYETFRGEIPHVVRAPMVDLSPEDRPVSPSRKSPVARLSFLSRLGQRLGGSKKRYSNDRCGRGIEPDKELEHERADILRRIRKRRSLERDRALFIMNKDAQQTTRACYKKTVTTVEDRENFTMRVKDLEEKLYGVGHQTVHATSPNAPRVIGKLDRGDWNVRLLEEKLKGQKPNAKKERQEVPKWNRDIFEEKLRAMDQRGKGDNLVEPTKFSAFDSCLQMLDKKLKEGNNLDVGQRGSNKVSTVAGQLTSMLYTSVEAQPLQRSNSKPCLINTQNISEPCHFCRKRVYLMERQSAQGKFFHRGCFKCECCGVALRLSSYGLAIVGPYNGKFLCLLHFGMRNPPRSHQPDGQKGAGGSTPTKTYAETTPARTYAERPPTRTSIMTTVQTPTSLDLPDVCSNKTRGVTPERVEFENTVEITSEEELLSEIDEDEWTDRNFGISANEYESSDNESDFSSSDEMVSENEDELEEAFQNSMTADETLKLAEKWKRRYFKKTTNEAVGGEEDDEETGDDNEFNEDYDESDEEYSYEQYENEDGDESTATEGEMQGGTGESSNEEVALTRDKYEIKDGVHLTITHPSSSNTIGQLDYQALKSSETETGSDGMDSEELTDSDTESESEGMPEGDADDEDEDRKRPSSLQSDPTERNSRKRCTKTIPTIVIDETTTRAPTEDDDAYFVTLQEQSMIAERTLEDLIVQEQSKSLQESAVQTPEELKCVQEDVRRLVAGDRELTKDEVECDKPEQPAVECETDYISDLDNKENVILTPKPIECSNVLNQVEGYVYHSASDVAGILKIASETGIQHDSGEHSSPKLAPSLLEVKESKVQTEVEKPCLVTESPTAKMMLKLKEQYLLGCSQNSDRTIALVSFPPVSMSPSAGATLEPTVKSCLELITEKQRMLLQPPSPALTALTSNLWPGFLAVDALPCSPSSTVSSSPSSKVSPSRSSIASLSPSSSEVSHVKISGSSSWSKILPISALEGVNQVVLQIPRKSNECEFGHDIRGPSPDLFEGHLTPMSLDSTSTKMLSTECQVTVERVCPLDVEVGGFQESKNLQTSCAEILSMGELDKDNIDLGISTRSTDADVPERDITVNSVQDETVFEELSSGNPYDDDLCFETIDSSKITLRKKESVLPDFISKSLHHTNDLKDKIEDSVDVALEDSSFPDVTSQNISNQESYRDVDIITNLKAAENSNSTAIHDQILEKMEQNWRSTGNEKMANLAKAEDDSLMGMSDSSDFDVSPGFDKKVYNTLIIEPVMGSNNAGYAGFSERIVPFRGSGVCDSDNIQKLRIKKFPVPLSIISKLEGLDRANVDVKCPVDLSASHEEKQQAQYSQKSPDNLFNTSEAEITCSSEFLEEIPFADDESTQQSALSSPNKKDQFFVEQRKFMRSLQRPLSMVETLLCSSSPPTPVSPKRWMLPDTPLTNPNMFDTPKTMKEAVDDLRQIRTVERERARQEARDRARLKSDEELGLRKVDYTVLKKKYQKQDDKLEFNIEEESGPHLVSSNVSLEIGISTSQQLPFINSSSSPDSEVFEEDIELPFPTQEYESKLSDVLQVEKELKMMELLQLNSPNTNSSSSSSNAPSPSDAAKSVSNTSTSKTDHPSSYLEQDMLVEAVALNMPPRVAKASENQRVSFSQESITVVGSNSKKDKQKRKSFLSLFSNFGKGKEKDEKKGKEKSPSPPSASLQGAADGEITVVLPPSPLESCNFKVDGMLKETRFPKLRLARSKEKVKEKLKQKKSSQQLSKESACPPQGSSSTVEMLDNALLFDIRPHSSTRTIQSGDITLDRHTLIASMASISRQIPQAEKVSIEVAPQATERSFSDNIELVTAQVSSSTGSAKKPKDVTEDRKKKFQKISQRVYRQQEQKRLRMAQEIQRQLEELEVKQRNMEARGVQVEKALRGEDEVARKDEGELMQEWFHLIHTKNVLVRQEQELMMKAKELELEDRHSRLQHKLHGRMAVDDVKKTAEEIEDEGQILTEMLEIVEQRDTLIALIEENKQRHHEEDKDVELSMQAKGMKLLPSWT